MKQGQSLVAKSAFAFKAPGARGRAVQVKPGQRFWVTNPCHDQQRTGLVVIDREGRGTICNGYAFSFESIAQYFQPA